MISFKFINIFNCRQTFEHSLSIERIIFFNIVNLA
jgi:hypothetical protein